MQRGKQPVRNLSRRQLMLGAGASLLLPPSEVAAPAGMRVAGQDVEIQIAPVSAHTFRLTILPFKGGQLATVPMNGSLVQSSWGGAVVKLRSIVRAQTVKSGNLRIKISPDPLEFSVGTTKGEAVQQ